MKPFVFIEVIMTRRKTTEEFIAEAKTVYGIKYDYSRVKYTGTHNKVTIGCKTHGMFEQEAKYHLTGRGCPKCLLKTTEEFIIQADLIHGGRYDYTSVRYKNSKAKVTIICKEHGDFLQSPPVHLRGSGCPRCFYKAHSKTTEEFIARAKDVHGDNLYNYSKVLYNGSTNKIIIICKSHGEFLQTPTSHLNGNGCPNCSPSYTKTLEDFVVQAVSVHGYKYAYKCIERVGKRSYVTIVCKNHGEFRQRNDSHMAGKGCSKCAKSGFKIEEETVFYIYTFGIYAGFGITNDFVTRNIVHQLNFKKYNAEATLLSTYSMSGKLALKLETHLKRTLPIVNSGIEGFKTEAVHIENLKMLLDEVNLTMNMIGV